MVLASLALTWSVLGLILFPMKKYTADTALRLRLSGILIIGLLGLISTVTIGSDYEHIVKYEHNKKGWQLYSEQVHLNEMIKK